MGNDIAGAIDGVAKFASHIAGAIDGVTRAIECVVKVDNDIAEVISHIAGEVMEALILWWACYAMGVNVFALRQSRLATRKDHWVVR